MFTSTQLAETILKTAEIREKSWAENPSLNIGSYNVAIDQAAEQATEDRSESHLVGMLLLACWNDALAWAERNKG